MMKEDFISNKLRTAHLGVLITPVYTPAFVISRQRRYDIMEKSSLFIANKEAKDDGEYNDIH